jgi:hypothetical protein
MPRHPPNALTSRLKTRTTNDSTARGQYNRGQYGLQTKSIVSCGSGRPKAERQTPYSTVSFKKNPFTMSKRTASQMLAAPYRHGLQNHGKPVASSWYEVVEPIGIEPMTSSLQS